MSSASPSASTSPSILLVGATGNTGTSAVQWLSRALSSSAFPAPAHSASAAPPRILALTRDVESEAAKKLAQLDHVEVVQKDWTEIDTEWLVQWQVFRVYIAHHNPQTQFTDESRFLIACKDAKVEYLVKLSTNTPFVTPDTPMDYARSHWAVEQLLRQPEFRSMPTTILRANVFTTSFLQSLVDSVKATYQTASSGERLPIRALISKDAPVAPVDPKDVGAAAGALLALPDPSAHYGRTYHLSGPNDVCGEDVVHLIEAKLGEKLTVEYQSMELLNEILSYVSKDLGKAIKLSSTEFLWKGLCGLRNNPMTQSSPELLELNIPRTTVQEFIDRAFE
uniref:NmrA-like domain-containing protein n=1 Tax=Globisporangium ultimum (strain ATCC 200006 / CBS 805.95 / DAOM BR144) TaxID=431595 RepID=K3WQD1_GLOUD